MKQGHISESLYGLDYKDKYQLTDYLDSLKHLYIFGMYRDYDLDVFNSHNSDITIIWCGSDAKNLTKDWAKQIKSKKNVRHISMSGWVQESLLKHKISSKIIQINAVKIIPELSNYPNGDFIYFYSSDNAPKVYNEEYIPQIIEKTKIPILRGSISVYDKKTLYEIYRKSFLNLRLTTHDGVPNTNLEMGLMGRKSIYNGDLPYSIKWKNIDSICDSIMEEYENRKKDNIDVSKEYIKFIEKNVL